MNIIGIDQSIRSTGVFSLIADEEHNFVVKGVNTFAHRTSLGEQIFDQLPDLQRCKGEGLVVVREGYSYGSRSQSFYQIGELVGCLGKLIAVARRELDIEPFIYMQVPPTTLKLWAFGTGAKKKDTAYLLDIAEIFGRSFRQDDLADSFMLAKFAEEFICSILSRGFSDRMKIALVSTKLKKKLKLTTKKKIMELSDEDFFRDVALSRLEDFSIIQVGDIHDMR
jgi:hypothetical protein